MKKDNKIALEKEDFSFVCPLKVDDMNSVDGGHFCGSCEKKVYDVSDFSLAQYEDLLKSQKDVCVSFTKIATISLALSLSACSSFKSEPILGKIVCSDKNSKSCDSNNKLSKDKKSSNSLKPYKVKDSKTKIVTTTGEPLPIKKRN